MAETKKLYHEDAYQVEFDARVVERREIEGRPAIVLDRTAFYPEAGCQSSDRGTLGNVAVVDVVDEAGTIVHVLAAPVEADQPCAITATYGKGKPPLVGTLTIAVVPR